jgi:saccharopine dehydrogenase-like NADP-dependent oxidoreductase
MTNILVFGAGKSSSFLIKYLLEKAKKYFWQVTVADANLNASLQRIGDSHFGTGCQLDIHEEVLRKRLISNSNIVISLLPPALHIVVARDCIALKRNLITASYVSDDIKGLHEEARNNGLLFMNEIGLDPGIDHMSSMKVIDEIERLGGDIHSFKSYCGGLVSPKSDNNPWHYKISWNPRNVVLAGKSGAEFLLNGEEKKLNYSRLFKEYEKVQVPGFGTLAAYANRDSLSYRSLYGLRQVKTMLRATFRYEEFCIGWNAVVNLGLTSEVEKYPAHQLTYYDWFMQSSARLKGKKPEDRIKVASDGNQHAVDLIDWLGLFSNEPIQASGEATSADILLSRVEQRWNMAEHDLDMIVMHHEFEYGRKSVNAKLSSTLIVEGENKTYTAMAKTVGLPMAIFTKLFLTKKINNLLGVQIPTMKDVYKPVLKELATYGIEFEEHFMN